MDITIQINNHNIIFSLNSADKIVIDLNEPLTMVHCCYQATLILFFDGTKYLFPRESIRYMLQSFVEKLEKAFKGKLLLDTSISDLGYGENEYYQDRPGLVYKNKQWVGSENRVWSGSGFTVWLYNNADGAIMLEITPVYRTPFDDPEDVDHYIPYEEWIEQYHACAKKEIPTETAGQWLKKARFILDRIESTMAREKLIYENDQGADLTNTWYTILRDEHGILDPRGVDADIVPTEFLTDEWWKKRGL